MVSSGMRAAGYRYVNIDGGWEGQRDAKGFIHPNKKFPDMRALADYVHRKGLKFGIYSSQGPKTCGSLEGSYGHEQQDAETYAKWGVDYLKYDWCSARYVYAPGEYPNAFEKMHQALARTGRPIVFSIHGRGNVWQWAGYFEIDTALEKRTAITEPVAIEFRAEAFNLFNRPIYGNPGANISSSSFGVITEQLNSGATGTGMSRRIQFMLRLEF